MRRVGTHEQSQRQLDAVAQHLANQDQPRGVAATRMTWRAPNRDQHLGPAVSWSSEAKAVIVPDWRRVVLAVSATAGALALLAGDTAAAGGHGLGAPARGAAGAAASVAPPTWHLVGLGDSVPAGSGCDRCLGFLDLFGQQVARATARRVEVTNLGVDGSTSVDLLVALTEDDRVAKVTGDADIITVTIGANDFLPMLDAFIGGRCGGADGLACFQPAIGHLRSNLSAILQRIRQLRGNRPTAVRVTGYWNVFIDGAVAARTYGSSFERASTQLTILVNEVIKQVALAEQARYVDLFARFKGEAGDRDDTELLAPDGDHPSQAGNQRIADALAQVGYRPISTGQ